MKRSTVTSETIRHKRYSSYKQRRLICAVSLACALICFAVLICLDAGVFNFMKETADGQMTAQETFPLAKYIRALIIFFIVAGAISAFRALLERMRESFFTAIIGAIATFLVSIQLFQSTVAYFEKNFPFFQQRYLLLFSFIAFGVFWFFFWGHYPMSTQILIDAMNRFLIYNDSIANDWVKEGRKDYLLEVFPLEEVIPQDVSRLSAQMSGVEREKLDEVLVRFFNRRPSADKTLEVFVLIGGFGSGKSTALARSVQKQLQRHRHYGEVPVYVKLRDWLIVDIFDDPDHNIYKYSRDEAGYYIDQLCNIIIGKMDEDRHKTIKQILTSLHESRRLVYVFDGLNELLQRSMDANEGKGEQKAKKGEQKAKDLCTFLYRFCAGNRCVISMCEMAHVLTTRSMLLTNQECNYHIYGVDGVSTQEKSKGKKDEDDWAWNYYHSVALYRLARNSMENGEKESQSMYQLLEDYVNRQIKNELIIESDKCNEKLKELIKWRINKTDNEYPLYYIAPYSSVLIEEENKTKIKEPISEEDLEEDLITLVNCRILYKIEKKEEGKEGKHYYHFCHILVYQFLLTQYIKEEYERIKDKNLFKRAFLGDREDNKTPQILKNPHLVSVLSMLISVYLKGNDDIKIQCLINEMLECSPDYWTDILILLSNINDELKKIQRNNRFMDIIFENESIKGKIDGHLEKHYNACELGQKIALLKLYGTEQKEQRIDDELWSEKNAPWIYMNAKRELLAEKINMINEKQNTPSQTGGDNE